MRIPLYVGMLPPNMTLTIDKIIETKPSGVDLWEEGVPKLPFTITSAQAETNRNKGWRGVRIGDFVSSMSGFGLGKNAGGVFDIRYTIAGRPDEAAGTGVQNIQGWLTISTSDWGILGRPDTTNFQWKVGESSVETYVADTPDLTYLDDTVITVVYVPESKEYMVGVTNQADTIVKFMQTAVKGILTLHEVAVDGVIDLAGGHVAAVAAGLGMKAVSWAAEEISSGDK
ncbi:uncharacterized protein CTRU02_200623 [Colletotrichum truncatum]|uniref:Uncharacterized protein n=1 Tax=Colletotrichum truncatum TaxID=5467 RepID=A0ACC3ZF44_COLTU|nr:uncharacterized protein CTRU02_00386 [Colletotrichum truncatum]KAF6801637.1 hypothetical protein CTRU02_00386 [Colletotrichum truncatum]